VAAEQITVKARTRRRTGANEPVPTEERWDQQTATSYEEARDAILDRLPNDQIVLAWYVDRS
jgi:hypothetical protein